MNPPPSSLDSQPGTLSAPRAAKSPKSEAFKHKGSAATKQKPEWAGSADDDE